MVVPLVAQTCLAARAFYRVSSSKWLPGAAATARVRAAASSLGLFTRCSPPWQCHAKLWLLEELDARTMNKRKEQRAVPQCAADVRSIGLLAL